MADPLQIFRRIAQESEEHPVQWDGPDALMCAAIDIFNMLHNSNGVLKTDDSMTPVSPGHIICSGCGPYTLKCPDQSDHSKQDAMKTLIALFEGKGFKINLTPYDKTEIDIPRNTKSLQSFREIYDFAIFGKVTPVPQPPQR